MKFKMKMKTVILICGLAIFLGLLESSKTMSARLAGEEDITPVSTEPNQRITSPPRAGETVKTDETKERGRGGEVHSIADTLKDSENTRYITIDFDNIDIQVFIKFISELTGKNFIVDEAVRGKVTIISPTKISVEEAYRVFESVLEVRGFTTVPAGEITKVVPAADARAKDIETRLVVDAITPEDKVVTQLIPLDYADPEELKKLFTPFISKSSIIASYPPTGILIVTDVLSNIKRLLNIVEAVDVEGIGEEVSVVPLNHARASSMAKSLMSVFQQRSFKDGKKISPGMPVVEVVPDERTNSIIILASENDTLRIRQLINLLDRETPRGEGDIHVYYLQNANADELSKVLVSLPTEQKVTEEKGKAPVISKEVQIVADKATNSLIITANRDDYLVLEDVIKKLDISRRMVYIEALIMEVSMAEQFDLGVQWLAGKSLGEMDGRDVGAFGGSYPGTGNFPSSGKAEIVSLPEGFSLGVLGDVISIGGIKFPNIGAVVRALRTDSNVRILSTPQIMTTDNEEAEIVVADNIPFLIRKDETQSGTDFSNYEFRDVGVTLNITPQINQERFVRLKISQEVSQVVNQETIGLPTTLKRLARTTITIKDGQTVVIGGLIDETENSAYYKVPVLGDIPLLGLLFRSTSKNSGKTNLYIFLTPHIIENPDEAKEVYEDKKEHIEKIEEGSVKMYERKNKKSEDMRLSDLGFMCLKANDYEGAIGYCRSALAINPDNPYALLNMGVAYEAIGDKENAVKMYKKVIATDSDEIAFVSTDPSQKGKKLTDIARGNLERLE
ncbi:MAG: type II secretion system secretin GspD [Deltaproteobacteria bacterium]|nr:type II secretion system secretin GspD [Deltaproteobacteria bacterium]